MKHSIKTVSMLVFAVLLYGCLPQEKLTGRVIDTAGPVPEAAVLGMVWIEDGDKARPRPDVKDLKPKDLDAALDKDMKDRGLPMAYARAFSDKDGRFTLDKLHFSAETKKAVKAMKQPRITRITLNAFQRGYLKHAATIFPKSAIEDLSPATVTLFRPESWKQLALDSSYVTLRRNEYDAGYSKEFGATKKEKEWFLEYTKSNLDKAYAESDIKGDKQWEEDCGHDYSDLIISTAGIYRNPASEKCNRLLHQMGVLREWKEEWLAHSQIAGGRTEPHISAVKEAINALGPEYAEVKANEGYIIAGVDEAENQNRKNQTNQNLRNGLNDSGTGTEEAQRLYNIGDKAGAYKALGGVLYSQMPGEVRQGPLTAQLTVKTLPGITDAVAGFYLLMNKPLTAQLPGGDGGNHKDKPGYKVEVATEITTGQKPVAVPVKPRMVKLDGIEVDLNHLEKAGPHELGQGTRREKTENGEEVDVKFDRRAEYFPRSKRIAYIERVDLDESGQGDLKVYDINGSKVFEKKLEPENGSERDFDDVKIIGTKYIATITEGYPVRDRRLEIYDSNNQVVLSTAFNYPSSIFVPPSEGYILLSVKGPRQESMELYKYDFKGLRKIAEGKGLHFTFFVGSGRGYITSGAVEIDEKTPSGDSYREVTLRYFQDDRELWRVESKYEERMGLFLSKTGRYLISINAVERKLQGDRLLSYKEVYYVYEISSGKLVAEGKLLPEIIEKYKNETIGASGK